MKKLFLISSVLFLCFVVSFAQEVKVKKNIILVDGNPVVKIKKEEWGRYKILDLKDNFLFVAESTDKTIKGNKGLGNLWLRLKGKNGNIREVELTNKSFSLNGKKIVARNLVVGPATLLTSSGIDIDQIKVFFAKNDTSISDNIENKYIQIQKKHEEEDRVAEDMKLRIDASGAILVDGNIVGNIEGGPFGADPEKGSYSVIDVENFNVATVPFSPKNESILKDCIVETFDKKELVVNALYTSEQIGEDELANRIVRMLYANGYAVEGVTKAFNEYKDKKYKEAYKKAEAESLNITEEEGYIKDENGYILKGLVSIPYENIDAKITNNINAPAYNGEFATLKIPNSSKIKMFKAKNEVKVVVGDRVFIGAIGIEDGGLTNANMFDNVAQFLELDYETDSGYVLHHPRTPQAFYIKLKKGEEAYYLGDKGVFGTKSTKKMEKLFDKFLKCPSMKFQDYDTLSKEGMIKILDDFTSKCEN